MEKPFTWKWGTARTGLTESNENIHIENTFSRIFFHSMYEETREETATTTYRDAKRHCRLTFLLFCMLANVALLFSMKFASQLAIVKTVLYFEEKKTKVSTCAVLSNSMPTYKFTMRCDTNPLEIYSLYALLYVTIFSLTWTFSVKSNLFLHFFSHLAY